MNTSVNWDDYFMGIASAVSVRSKDRSTKLGCVIVGPDKEIRSTGYNSFPRGIDDNREERHERPEKYSWTEHAERNAIYAAAKVGTPLDGCTAYISWIPCMDCARGLVQAGIKRVVGKSFREDDPKWSDDFKRVKVLFEEANVELEFI